MHAEWGDARLGVMGILGTVRIMGNRWGVMEWLFGFAWAFLGDGAAECGAAAKVQQVQPMRK